MAEQGIFSEFDVAGEAFLVTHARLEDRVDAVPSLWVTLERDGELPKPASLLGADAKLVLGELGQRDAARKFQGIVVRGERRLDAEGHPTLRLEVRPKLHRLSLRADVRTFQKKSVVEIAEEVILGGGAGPVRVQVTASYEPRDFVVQYRETDLEFLLRILSEDGVSIAFDHESGEVVLFDDPHGVGEAADVSVTYRPEFGFGQTETSVSKVAETHKVVSDKVLLRDYDPARPRFTLEAAAESADDGEHALEVYAFPARTADDGAVERRAQALLDALQGLRDVVDGSTTAWRLYPGQRFKIEGHPYAALDVELLAVGLHLVYEETRSSFGEDRHRISLRFEAVPTERTKYRPPRRPAARRVLGVQTALTTGPSGQEVHVDDQGRVTVIYPWDRVGKKDETSSTGMRTLQLGLGGSMLLPRVGWEVLTTCTDGDPDLPLVVGRLYNAEKPPPYSLPGGMARSSIQTATTPGGGSANELRTDDSAGSEEMFFNASKDMTIMVKNNTTESVGNNATLSVGSNQTVNVTNSLDLFVGASQSVTVGGNQKIATETFRVDDAGGDHTLDVGGNRDMKIGGDHKITVGADESLDVGSMKTHLVVGSIDETVGGKMDLSVGAVRVALTAGDHTTDVGGKKTESAGAAKVSLAFGSKAAEISGNNQLQVGGAAAHLIKGDRAETAGGMLTEVATGARILKADNVVFEAETMLTLVMGASVVSLMPGLVTVLGISVKLDGDVGDGGPLIMDN